MIRLSLDDLRKSRNDMAFNCGMAAGWAAVLMTMDILKHGVSAADKRAAVAFSVIDKGIEQANKLLIAFDRAPIERKEDALKSLDPGLRKASDFVQQVNQARSLLKGLGLKEKDQLGLTLDIASDMAQDTLLLLNVGVEQQRLGSMNDSAMMAAAHRLSFVQESLRKLDAEIDNVLRRYDLVRTTA
jgi:hypothetical protein